MSFVVNQIYCPECGGELDGTVDRRKFRVYNEPRAMFHKGKGRFRYEVEYAYNVECEKCHWNLYGDEAKYEIEAFRQGLTDDRL